MKVTLLKEDKKFITLEQSPIVRQIIANMKEDEYTAEKYADMVIRADDGKLSKVLEYGTGTRVEIPVNSDGSVKWYEDRQKTATD